MVILFYFGEIKCTTFQQLASSTPRLECRSYYLNSGLSILKSFTSIVFEPIAEYQIMQGIAALCIQQADSLNIPTHFWLSPKDFNIIKIQFYALGYIELGTQIDPDDGERYSNWIATDKGKRVILDLVAIKA